MLDHNDVEIMYCVLGQPRFRPILLKSIESIRSNGYSGPIAVLTDLDPHGWELCSNYNFEIRAMVPPYVAERYGGKPLVDRYTSAARLVVLDCDVVAVAPFDGLWKILDEAEFAIGRDVCPTLWEAVQNDLRLKPQNVAADMRDALRLCGVDAPYFNSGVFAYRRSLQMHDLFATWYEEWKVYRGSNQYPLLRALHRLGVVPRLLDWPYNADARWYDTRQTAVAAGAKLVHFFGRPIETMLQF